MKNKRINKGVIFIIISLFLIIIILISFIFIKGYQKDIKIDFLSFKKETKINLDNFFKAKYTNELNSNKYLNVWGLENVEKLKDGSYKIYYPAGSYKPSAKPRGGAGFIYKLDKKYNKAKLTYKIKFDKDFQFVKGGKLPGFCGGECPRGGHEKNKGFSTRYMWRAGGKIELYTYLPHDNSILGVGFGKGNFRFKKDKFYTISQELIMNDVGVKNGILTLIIDGKRIYKKEDIIYRESTNIGIDSILFSTFFGGGDKSFATPIDTFIIMKDFKIDY